jgi:hypothetical protein
MVGWNVATSCAVPSLHDWFDKQWEGIEQVFRLERTARLLKTHETRHEVVYGLEHLSMRHAPPWRMLHLVKDIGPLRTVCIIAEM